MRGDMLLGWCCGFFDGEGCIRLSRSLQPTITISQGDVSALQLFQSVFGGQLSLLPTGVTNLSLRVEEQQEFLERATPHLIVKRAQAELLQRYFILRGQKAHKNLPRSLEAEEEVAAMYWKLRELKTAWRVSG
jgi:hypothetical protein